MCKNLLKGLLGGGGEAVKQQAVPQPTVTPEAKPDAPVKNPDIAVLAGREASGRVKLGTPDRRKSGRTTGLTI